jgi:hypothetical protein
MAKSNKETFSVDQFESTLSKVELILASWGIWPTKYEWSKFEWKWFAKIDKFPNITTEKLAEEFLKFRDEFRSNMGHDVNKRDIVPGKIPEPDKSNPDDLTNLCIAWVLRDNWVKMNREEFTDDWYARGGGYHSAENLDEALKKLGEIGVLEKDKKHNRFWRLKSRR